ncbi:MAG: DUF1877 family protein [Actinobacteria bacterium]|nr:DUF1877 family protein [Actinomycetota bacterium]
MPMPWVARSLTDEERAQLVADPTAATTLAAVPGKQHIELKTTWHGLKWLLAAGEDIPSGAEDAILGGTELPSQPGHPVRLLDATAVERIAAALGPVTADDVREAFDIDQMLDASVYPPIWDEPDVLEKKVVPAFEKLRRFYLTSAAEKHAVLIVVG